MVTPTVTPMRLAPHGPSLATTPTAPSVTAMRIAHHGSSIAKKSTATLSPNMTARTWINATRNLISPLCPLTGRLQENCVTCVPLPPPHEADPINRSPPALRTILCHGPQWSHGYQRREHRPQL